MSVRGEGGVTTLRLGRHRKLDEVALHALLRSYTDSGGVGGRGSEGSLKDFR